MSRLEELTPKASLQGILPNGLVPVVNTQWHGFAALERTYKTADGNVAYLARLLNKLVVSW